MSGKDRIEIALFGIMLGLAGLVIVICYLINAVTRVVSALEDVLDSDADDSGRDDGEEL